MFKYCCFCNSNHELPILGQSNEDWYWQPNKNTSLGGSYVCKTKKRQKTYEWERKNPEKAKAKHKKNRDRRRSTGKGRLRHSFSSLMSCRLSGKSNKETFKAVSYSLKELMNHLESKFQPGMSWDNYGKWEVDHCVPDCAFEYTSIKDQSFQDCWALSNLQPLWAKDNKIKNGNI